MKFMINDIYTSRTTRYLVIFIRHVRQDIFFNKTVESFKTKCSVLSIKIIPFAIASTQI